MDALTLTLPAAVHRRLVEHAHQANPAEAIGLLGGQADGLVMMAAPMVNIAPVRSFFADPHSQFSAERAIREAGLITLAVYHSHPGGGATPSELDRAFAAHSPLPQVIIAFDRPHRPGVEIRAFRQIEGLPHEVDLRILP